MELVLFERIWLCNNYLYLRKLKYLYRFVICQYALPGANTTKSAALYFLVPELSRVALKNKDYQVDDQYT